MFYKGKQCDGLDYKVYLCAMQYRIVWGYLAISGNSSSRAVSSCCEGEVPDVAFALQLFITALLAPALVAQTHQTSLTHHGSAQAGS